MITSYSSETWDLMNRGTDKDTGQPVCHVRRVKTDHLRSVCVWRLVKYPNGWHNVGQYIGGLQGYRPSPERKGKLLSNSRTDLMLRSFAEAGHGALYA